jgi:homoserine dehydrogenase
VGQALARLIATQPALGAAIQIVAVADRNGVARAPSGHALERLLVAKAAGRSVGNEPPPESLAQWAADLDCDCIVDALPSNLDTGEPSRSIALAALRAGKHVVTANKGLLAQHGAEALAVAKECGRSLRSGAAVGGGTPVLELLSDAFRGDQVLRFEAVLNGSTNFVLCELERGATWDAALRKARDGGILEADPSLDLSGRDAAAKAVILANSLWGLGWRLQDARVQGIWGLDQGEAKDALVHGLAIRLIVRADPEGGVRVAPVALPREHPLVLEGTENAVRFTLRSAGTVTLRGPGAGGVESASKVLSDLLAIAAQAR